MCDRCLTSADGGVCGQVQVPRSWMDSEELEGVCSLGGAPVANQIRLAAIQMPQQAAALPERRKPELWFRKRTGRYARCIDLWPAAMLGTRSHEGWPCERRRKRNGRGWEETRGATLTDDGRPHPGKLVAWTCPTYWRYILLDGRLHHLWPPAKHI